MAYRTGAIQSGDKLLAIDNFRLEGCSVEDAAHILQSASSVVQLRLQKEEVPTIAEGNRRKPLFMFGFLEALRVIGTLQKHLPMTKWCTQSSCSASQARSESRSQARKKRVITSSYQRLQRAV